MRRRAVLLVCLLAAAGARADVDTARARGLAWLVQTQRGDGSFAGPRGLEVQATAAAVEAMLDGGLARSPHYARALSWLANAPAGSLDAQAWQTAALARAGRDATRPAVAVRDARSTFVAIGGGFKEGSIAVWGAYPGYGASTPDTAQGYGALRSAGVTYTNDLQDGTVTALCVILPAQLAAAPWSGAWPQALPQSGQPASQAPGSLAATAAVLHELKQQRQANRFLSGSACGYNSPSSIDTAMTSAKTWLLAQANADGGFAERSPKSGALEASNLTATALAVRALAPFAAAGDAPASTAINKARAWLAGRQATNGSWGGDPFVTARVLAALPPATGAQVTDSDADGLTDAVEVSLGTQTAIADAQGQVNNAGNSVAGVTTTGFNASGVVGQSFSQRLPVRDGTYSLAHGALPTGLTLAGDGTLSGVPSQPGSYAFNYRVSGNDGSQTQLIARIDIAAAEPGSDGDVPLPGWALAVLGGALLQALRRRGATPT